MTSLTFYGGAGEISGNKVLRVLFVCLGNSVRSIMAEYLADQLDWVDASSAGVYPSSSIYFMTIKSLAETDIFVDAGRKPTSFSNRLDEEWDLIISLDPKATEEITNFNVPDDTKLITWNIKDPTGHPLQEFNKVRDKLRDKIFGLK